MMMHPKVKKKIQMSNIREKSHKVSKANDSDEKEEGVQSITLDEEPENCEEKNKERKIREREW